jgi:hypothetical protein
VGKTDMNQEKKNETPLYLNMQQVAPRESIEKAWQDREDRTTRTYMCGGNILHKDNLSQITARSSKLQK